MLDKVYLCFARVFSTWTSLRLLMVSIIVWLIICLGLSGWEAQAAGGDVALIKWKSGSANYAPWVDFCSTSPYNVMSPFAFTFIQYNVTESTKTTPAKKDILFQTSTKTICPWGSSNNSFRFVILVFSLLSVVALFFKTHFSLFARTVAAFYSLLFFASFVLDANASAVGLAQCSGGFVNTKFNQDLVASNVVLGCTGSDFQGLSFIDLLISALFSLLYTAWGLCTSHYAGASDHHADKSKDLSYTKDIELEEEENQI